MRWWLQSNLPRATDSIGKSRPPKSAEYKVWFAAEPLVSNETITCWLTVMHPESLRCPLPAFRSRWVSTTCSGEQHQIPSQILGCTHGHSRDSVQRTGVASTSNHLQNENRVIQTRKRPDSNFASGGNADPSNQRQLRKRFRRWRALKSFDVRWVRQGLRIARGLREPLRNFTLNKHVEHCWRLLRNLTESWTIDLKPASNQGFRGYISYDDLGMVDPVVSRLKTCRRIKHFQTVKLAINVNSNNPDSIKGVSFFPPYCCDDRLLGVAHGDCAEQE